MKAQVKKIKKILVANRGEIAVRIIRSCRELGIRTVAVWSDADAAMPHVRTADEAIHIGPSPSKESYLLGDVIMEAAVRSDADAIHPGYGFLSENASFADLVRSSGLIFIGPRTESIRMMGDKLAARQAMITAGVPVVPGTEEPVTSTDHAEQFAREIGFPILIKAAAGGGGKGMRTVWESGELRASMRAAKSEASSAFGDDRVYIEKYLEKPRHIEFQVLADQYGATVHLGERECSIQRRHQKVIEESPSVFIDDEIRHRMGSAAVKSAEACHYMNAGTVEFLMDRHRNFYFLEMNTRLQVEHPVTEFRTGIDLVAEQIRIAEGEELGYDQEGIPFNGHAIECRIYAEDPANGYLPSTGTIHVLRAPQGLGIRDDRGIEQGGNISVYYDPMISKLVVWGQTRDQAIARMQRALRDYLILGVTTNIPLNLSIMNHPRFISGDFDTHFLDEAADELRPESLVAIEEYAIAGLAAFLRGRQVSSSPIVDQRHWDGQSGPDDGLPEISKWKQSRIRNMQR